MTEPTQESPAPPARRWTRLLLGCCGGCGAFMLAAVIVVIVITSQARRRLDVRVAEAKQRAAAPRGSTERPVLDGEPVDGDAVDDYSALEWVLAPPDAWTQPPANMPPTDLARSHPGGWRGLTALTNALPERGTPLDARGRLVAKTADVCATYGGLRRHVRAGLGKSRCDWSSRGVAAPPSPVALRIVAGLLAAEAVTTAGPEEATRLGLEAVAFGADVGRGEGLDMLASSVTVRMIGLRSLGRTLNHRALVRADLERIVTALGRLEPADLDRALAADRVAREAELAGLVGALLDGSRTRGASDRLLAQFGSPQVELEWTRAMDRYDRSVQAALLPAAEEAAARAALEVEAKKSALFVLAKVIGADPSHADAARKVREARAASDECVALQSLTRMVAAGHLHRLERGAFPATAAELAPYLGGAVPLDPFAPGTPLRLELRPSVDGGGETLRCWSAQAGTSRHLDLMTCAPR